MSFLSLFFFILALFRTTVSIPRTLNVSENAGMLSICARLNKLFGARVINKIITVSLAPRDGGGTYVAISNNAAPYHCIEILHYIANEHVSHIDFWKIHNFG